MIAYPTAEDLRSRFKWSRGTPAGRLASCYVIEASGCWRWTKGLTTVGYGHFSIRSVYYQAHLLLYIFHVGPIPEGLEPDHLCRNRWCVNPRHLEFVTHAVNVQRGVKSALSQDQVDAIRAARLRGAGVRALARQYGVNHGTISRLVRGLTWAEPAKVEAAA